MREVLIRSPSLAFAFGVQTLHSSKGLSPLQGRIRRPIHRPSQTAVACTLLRWHPACDQQSQPRMAVGSVCVGTQPQRVVRLASGTAPGPRYARAFARGSALPQNAQTRLRWQGASAPFWQRGEKPASSADHSSPGSS